MTTPATPAAVTRALARVLAWEPDLAPDDRYVPLAEVDLEALARAVARRMGDPPLRVGWSTAVMGIASRLWSLTVVPYVVDGVLPDPATILLRHDEGAVTLGVREPRGWVQASVDDLERAVHEVVDPLVAATPLSPRLLWGNVAGSLATVPRVHVLPRARPVVAHLLDGPGLAGEVVVRPDGSTRRGTCCLFWQVPGAGLCGDCVLDTVPTRRPTRGGRAC
ncbi:(2Fe-2S)-binding protein [Nocardioides litoris]|uniref:(2Fe-2S)-binding protein n=1 Tax=Nocardioides litoris TaxID=1926648 RepID=UPI001121A3A5|nr:(2Fe-2S)-binding protein [Nocardioides litoris]